MSRMSRLLFALLTAATLSSAQRLSDVLEHTRIMVHPFMWAMTAPVSIWPTWYQLSVDKPIVDHVSVVVSPTVRVGRSGEMSKEHADVTAFGGNIGARFYPDSYGLDNKDMYYQISVWPTYYNVSGANNHVTPKLSNHGEGLDLAVMAYWGGMTCEDHFCFNVDLGCGYRPMRVVVKDQGKELYSSGSAFAYDANMGFGFQF